MSRTANKITPTVKSNVLYSDDDGTSVTVGSEEWFGWLETASAFYYEAPIGTFTAKREKRRGSFYWFAYRRTNNKLHNAYLGKDDILTADHLAEVASKLHIKANDTTPDRVPITDQVTQQAGHPVAFDPSLPPTATIYLDHPTRQALRDAAQRDTIWRDAHTQAGVRYLLDLGMLINARGTPKRTYYQITDAGRDLAAQLPTLDEEWANMSVNVHDPAYLNHRPYTIRWAGKLPETDLDRQKRYHEDLTRAWEAKVKERQALKSHDLAWLVKDIQDQELSPDLFDRIAVPHSVEMIYKACAIEYERRHGQRWNWGVAIEWRQGHGFYAMPDDTFVGSHRKKALTAIVTMSTRAATTKRVGAMGKRHQPLHRRPPR